jgi:serine/threonine protein kinase/lipoprotein NlpI
MWQANQTINNDRFLIQKVLGGGGFGIAFQALDRKHNQPVVIKTLNQHQQLQPGFDELQVKFVNEAMTLKGLSHPQIVKVHELIQEQGLWGMVMEYIDGQELAAYIEERGTLTESQALGYIEQVGKALIYTHQQKVIHRDIKPHNIMLRAGNLEAVLIDFGLAREFIDGKTLSMTNSRTPAYAPIEQYERHGRFGAYTDVYALAATLYHLLTGTPPLPANYRQLNYPLSPPSSLNPQVSKVIDAGIMWALELQPQDRPQSIEEFLQLLGLGIPAVASTGLMDAKAYFDRARQTELNDPQGALADYDRAIALDPNYRDAYFNRAFLKQPEFYNDLFGTLADYKDLQGALADYDRAIALDPNYPNVYFNRAMLKADNLNDLQGALADYNQLIALDPNFAYGYFAYYYRALLKKNHLNDPQGALADFNQAIALHPPYDVAYCDRALLKQYNLNDPHGALADYNQLIALDSNFAEAYYYRALLKKNHLNDPQGALADYNQIIALDPNDAEAYCNRALLKQYNLKDFQGALADFNQAIAFDPNYAAAYYARALLKRYNLKDFQGALTDFNQAIALDSNYTYAYYNRRLLEQDNPNDPQGALTEFNPAIDLDTTNKAAAYYARALLKQYNLKDFQGARADFNQAIALDPNYTYAYYNRALLKKDNLKDFHGAIADIKKAVQLFQAQGNTEWFNKALDLLRMLA